MNRAGVRLYRASIIKLVLSFLKSMCIPECMQLPSCNFQVALHRKLSLSYKSWKLFNNKEATG